MKRRRIIWKRKEDTKTKTSVHQELFQQEEKEERRTKRKKETLEQKILVKRKKNKTENANHYFAALDGDDYIAFLSLFFIHLQYQKVLKNNCIKQIQTEQKQEERREEKKEEKYNQNMVTKQIHIKINTDKYRYFTSMYSNSKLLK